jgi:hypothetical protein
VAVTAAEALVAGIVVALCCAIYVTRGTISPWVSALLTALAVLSALAVALHAARWFG